MELEAAEVPSQRPRLTRSKRLAEAHSDTVAVTVVAGEWRRNWPGAKQTARKAASAALDYLADRVVEPLELSIALADDSFIRNLNRIYRDKDVATNVLAFPQSESDQRLAVTAISSSEPVRATLMGDVVLAFETVVREAAVSQKEPDAHLAHLVVHGVLHLFGFDHEKTAESKNMIAAEKVVLEHLGLADPYALPHRSTQHPAKTRKISSDQK